jgi:CubicO group peptidase (beta-lactamase class C family)
MMKMFFTLVLLVLSSKVILANEIYFPPAIGNWETIVPESLNWDTSKITPLYDFLEQKKSKAFIVLKDGKIVLEKYFGAFTKDSVWYWASAGKSMTSLLVGIAQEDGKLQISDPTSKYLGVGWTICPKDKEDKITIRHQITMTSGLDDGVEDNHCTKDSCLEYLADAGTRWAYHNAPYTLLEKVLESATGLPINTYTQQKLKNATGITGAWFTVDYDNIFFSKPRSMARYGILIQNHCIWNKDTLLRDQTYYNSMINTSQDINKSYGYLWWLNGKESSMLPGLQLKFNTMLFPSAPKDMFSALGKNGQFLNIVPSLGIVMVRMGDAASEKPLEVSVELNDQIWEKFNEIIKRKVNVDDSRDNGYLVYPNPATEFIKVKGYSGKCSIFNSTGNEVWSGLLSDYSVLNIENIKPGLYFLRIDNSLSTFIKY